MVFVADRYLQSKEIRTNTTPLQASRDSLPELALPELSGHPVTIPSYLRNRYGMMSG